MCLVGARALFRFAQGSPENTPNPSGACRLRVDSTLRGRSKKMHKIVANVLLELNLFSGNSSARLGTMLWKTALESCEKRWYDRLNVLCVQSLVAAARKAIFRLSVAWH